MSEDKTRLKSCVIQSLRNATWTRYEHYENCKVNHHKPYDPKTGFKLIGAGSAGYLRTRGDWTLKIELCPKSSVNLKLLELKQHLAIAKKKFGGINLKSVSDPKVKHDDACLYQDLIFSRRKLNAKHRQLADWLANRILTGKHDAFRARRVRKFAPKRSKANLMSIPDV